MKRFIITAIACMLCWFASAQSAFRLHYWFDTQHDSGVTAISENGSWQTLLETDGLSTGFHTLYTQVQDSSGRWFAPQSYLFYKSPTQPDANEAMPYVMWIDQDIEHSYSGDFLNENLLLDVGHISTGFHTINMQFGSGSSATLKSFLFYKSATQPAANETMAYTMWIDQDIENKRTGTFRNEHLILDLGTISTGFHTLYMQFGEGSDATLKSTCFYRKPHAELQIVRYEYWQNDLDSLKQVVNVTPQDTVDLITLLPLEPQPIRTTNFLFNPNDGTPVVNAKNEIHFKFYNAQDRIATRTFPYIDYNVVDTIYADTIERNTTRIVEAPSANRIHWFKLSAGVGDSLSFRTDKPCIMHLFAPSGAEVFKLEGQDAVRWKGCHSFESGTYYLAVHDVEDTGTIAVSYQWLYRYAVIAWDVHRVGNGGISSINFEGNGFNSLDTVYLYKGTDTIPALYIGRERKTTTSVVFNFENADTGMYQALFKFVDEDIFKTEVVYVETAKPIVLTTTCSYPQSFMRGGTVTYTYSITNTGNMTAYSVPMHIAIISSTKGISHIDVKGLDSPLIIANIDIDTIPEPYRQELIDKSKEIGDDHNFNRAFYVDSVTNDTVLIRANNLSFNIAPYETRSIEIIIKSNDSVNVLVATPDSINTMTYMDLNYAKINPHAVVWSCINDVFKCHLNYVSMDLSIIGIGLAIAEAFAGTSVAAAIDVGGIAIASCAVGFLQMIEADFEGAPHDNVSRFQKQVGWGNTLYNTIFDCLSAAIPVGKIKDVIKKMSTLGDFANTWVNWDFEFLDEMPNTLAPLPAFMTVPSIQLKTCIRRVYRDQNCIECKSGGSCEKGGTSKAVVPVDPNDITGHIAESGSHAIAAEQMQVPYMIEFENDTTFATASANTVIVRDTLDGNVFDLESFSSTSFTIGENVTTVDGGQTFVQTVDMRPNIDVLAQVALDYAIDSTFSVATWTFTSIDPMTLEPTNDPTLGFLPANYNGDGIGEVNFTINRKATLTDSATIDNRAYIVFDNEDPIVTPTWRNIVDNTAPISRVDSVTYNGGTATVAMHATDNLSGVWRYNVYGQIGESWLLLATNIAADTAAVVEAVPEQYDSFRTTAIDSAGNVEPLRAAPPTIYDTLNVTSCDQYTWYASTYTESGEYIRRALSPIPGYNDTVTTLILTINSSSASDTSASACDSFEWHDSVYSTSTTLIHTVTNAYDCDSVVTLHLTVNHSNTAVEAITACDSLEWNGATYRNEGLYEFDTVNAIGCDSIVTLNLTLNHSASDTLSVTVSDSYEWNGRIIENSGVYYDTLQTTMGCDSVIVLNLTLLQSIEQVGSEVVNVYPNPTRGKVEISVDGIKLIDVYDVNGRFIGSFRNTRTIDLSSYPVGLYTLRIETASGHYVCRVTRQ